MPRYENIADLARQHINKMVNQLDPPGDASQDYINDQFASDLLYLYNLGIRTAPRGVQSTVRLRAIQIAARNQQVEATLKPVTKEFGGRVVSYKALRLRSTTSEYVLDDLTEDGEE